MIKRIQLIEKYASDVDKTFPEECAYLAVINNKLRIKKGILKQDKH